MIGICAPVCACVQAEATDIAGPDLREWQGEKDDWRTMLEKKESPANLNNGVTPAGRVETVVQPRAWAEHSADLKSVDKE